jgi:CBS domain containing-hemolysin-like protein
LLELFKQSAMRMATIVDEHGALEGLVSIEDALEAIVGQMPAHPRSGREPRRPARRRVMAARRQNADFGL